MEINNLHVKHLVYQVKEPGVGYPFGQDFDQDVAIDAIEALLYGEFGPPGKTFPSEFYLLEC